MRPPNLRLPEREALRSILVLKPSSLGDVVHTLPAVAALKHAFPHARLRWLVNPEWAPLLEANPVVDEVLHFPRASFRGPAAPLRLWRWARQFAATGASDLVLDFQCLLRSALVGRFCRRSFFYGLSDAREGARFFYDAAVPVHAGQHAVDRYLALVQALGVPVVHPLEWPLPSAAPPPGFCAEAPFVALHPFSRGAGKSLAVADVVRLCEALAPARVVLLGRSELALPALAHVENWLNRTSLSELCAILRQAAWTVSVDSGPMHIAAAFSPRVVAIHTWSDPQRVGPYPGDAWIWQQGRLFQRARPTEAAPLKDPAALAEWLGARLAAPYPPAP